MKQRYDHVNALHDEIERSDRQLARVSPRPNGVSPQFDTEGRYDGVGTLTRVSSPRTARRNTPSWTSMAGCAIT